MRVATSTVSTVESTRDATCTRKRSRRLFTRSASAPPGNENNAMPTGLAADDPRGPSAVQASESLTSHACAAWRSHVPTLDTAIPRRRRGGSRGSRGPRTCATSQRVRSAPAGVADADSGAGPDRPGRGHRRHDRSLDLVGVHGGTSDDPRTQAGALSRGRAVHRRRGGHGRRGGRRGCSRRRRRQFEESRVGATRPARPRACSRSPYPCTAPSAAASPRRGPFPTRRRGRAPGAPRSWRDSPRGRWPGSSARRCRSGGRG